MGNAGLFDGNTILLATIQRTYFDFELMLAANTEPALFEKAYKRYLSSARSNCFVRKNT
ncbi:hypothetical protein D3C80_2140670 [compost metagenome]